MKTKHRDGCICPICKQRKRPRAPERAVRCIRLSVSNDAQIAEMSKTAGISYTATMEKIVSEWLSAHTKKEP